MRGIPSSVTTIRKKVFTEVARLAYDGDYDRMEKLPYIIVPGEEAKYRESIFLERAIAGERVRLAMGLGIRPKKSGHRMMAQDPGMEVPFLPMSFSTRAVPLAKNRAK